MGIQRNRSLPRSQARRGTPVSFDPRGIRLSRPLDGLVDHDDGAADDAAFLGPHPDCARKSRPEALEGLRLQMEQVMQVLDVNLATKDYIAGDELTIGDIPVGCFAHRWYALPMEHGNHAHAAAWYARLAERPAFQNHVMLPLS